MPSPGRPRLFAWSVVAALSVALVGCGLYWWSVAREREAALAATQARLNQTRAVLAQLDRQAAARAREAATAVAIAVAPAASTRRSTSFGLPPEYRDHPALVKAAYLPLVRKYLAGFYREAGLSAAETAACDEIVTAAGMGLEMGLFPRPNVTGDFPAEMVARLADELQAQVSERLGPAIGEKFAEALRTREVRGVADQLAVQMFYTEAPLSGTQSAQLRQVLLAAAPGAASGGEQLLLETLDWDRVLIQAPAFLAAPQLSALEALRAKALFDREYRRLTGYPPTAKLPLPEK